VKGEAMNKVFRSAIYGLTLALILGTPVSTSWEKLELKEVDVCPQGPPHCLFSSIQAAVDTVAEGGLVRVLPGKYQENVIIDKSLTLCGFEAEDQRGGVDSLTTTLLIAKYPELPAIAIEARGVTIENLVLRGHGDPRWKRERERGVVHIRGTSQKIRISHNRIEAEEIGIGVMPGSQEIYIEENLVIAPYQCVPEWRGSAALLLEEAEGIYIRRNTLLARLSSVSVQGGDEIEVVENLIGQPCFAEVPFGSVGVAIEGKDWDDIERLAQGLPPRRAKVVGNKIFGPGMLGIGASGLMEVEVVHNQISGRWLMGIQGFALNLMIRKNTIIGGGIGIHASGGVLQLEDNTVVDNDWTGIIVGTRKEQQGELKVEGKAILWGNIVAHSAGYGITLSLPQCIIEDLERIAPNLAEPFGFEGELIGEGNIIVRANKGDLCPVDYPWPVGFAKGP
jgi:nitrous oxidase accessory protein NosD